MSNNSLEINRISPPVPPLNLNEIKLPLLTTSIKKRSTVDECTWASCCPELQKACYLSRVCAVTPPKRCQFKNVCSILQEGPTCGLTALSMLLGGTPSPEELLIIAKERMYTNNGEVFSAKNFFHLICDKLMQRYSSSYKDLTLDAITIVNSNSENAIDCQLFEGRLNCAKVKESLQSGGCIFVPYDPDFNHAPCLKFGHKAHWALIIGYLINDNNEFYVIARHGKAKNLGVWSLKALSSSNSNLIEFAQPKRYPDCDFLLPEGGISGELGLRERAIIVMGVPIEMISIV